MFNLRFLDEIREFVMLARDNINKSTSGCKDIVNAYSDVCKQAIINHITEVKVFLAGHVTAKVEIIMKEIASGKAPAVKGVQRGVVHGRVINNSGREFDKKYKDITINAVNLNKAIVVIACGQGFTTLTSATMGRLVNATTLRLYQNYFSNSLSEYDGIFAAAWEVVEFF